ncbi:hypothetical protein AAZX31_16G019000 [Glycine max]|nr:hypothetical protein JHK85_044738 [Glycine max]KAG5107353.1 hypothetical protein JHK84_044260 [Glycine max]
MRKSLKKTKGVVNSSQRSILSFMVSTQILNYGRSFIGILNIMGNCEQDSENLNVVADRFLKPRTFDQNSEAKTPNMVVVMMMKGLVPINQATNVSEFLNMARDGDGALLIKAILFLCLFEKLHEERVVDVNHRHYEPLLLFSLTNLNCHAPFWDPSELLLLILPFTMMVMVQIETLAWTLLSNTHFFLPPRKKERQKETRKKEDFRMCV